MIFNFSYAATFLWIWTVYHVSFIIWMSFVTFMIMAVLFLNWSQAFAKHSKWDLAQLFIRWYAC